MAAAMMTGLRMMTTMTIMTSAIRMISADHPVRKKRSAVTTMTAAGMAVTIDMTTGGDRASMIMMTGMTTDGDHGAMITTMMTGITGGRKRRSATRCADFSSRC